MGWWTKTKHWFSDILDGDAEVPSSDDVIHAGEKAFAKGLQEGGEKLAKAAIDPKNVALIISAIGQLGIAGFGKRQAQSLTRTLTILRKGTVSGSAESVLECIWDELSLATLTRAIIHDTNGGGGKTIISYLRDLLADCGQGEDSVVLLQLLTMWGLNKAAVDPAKLLDWVFYEGSKKLAATIVDGVKPFSEEQFAVLVPKLRGGVPLGVMQGAVAIKFHQVNELVVRKQLPGKIDLKAMGSTNLKASFSLDSARKQASDNRSRAIAAAIGTLPWVDLQQSQSLADQLPPNNEDFSAAELNGIAAKIRAGQPIPINYGALLIATQQVLQLTWAVKGGNAKDYTPFVDVAELIDTNSATGKTLRTLLFVGGGGVAILLAWLALRSAS